LHSSNDKVSVIIPVYNSEKFLKDSINSVLNQTYQNLEIIAIDDGSTDNSLKILQKYSDKITIIHQENKGLADALNVGIKNMGGKWFKWFSPDDVLYNDAIEILVNEAKKLPENTIIYSNWELIDDVSKKIRYFSESNYNELNTFEYNVRLLDGQQINVNTTLIPASLFKKGCLIQNLEDPIAIDYDFFLRAGILYETKFNLISKVLIQYRIHSLQSSHKNIVKTLSYLPKVRNNILSKIKDAGQKQHYKIKLLH
jgi:glycosyltransferase involved in cell wall biosynthesis